MLREICARFTTKLPAWLALFQVTCILIFSLKATALWVMFALIVLLESRTKNTHVGLFLVLENSMQVVEDQGCWLRVTYVRT